MSATVLRPHLADTHTLTDIVEDLISPRTQIYLGGGWSGHQPEFHCNRVPLQLLAANNKHYLQGEQQHQEGEQAHTDHTPSLHASAAGADSYGPGARTGYNQHA